MPSRRTLMALGAALLIFTGAGSAAAQYDVRPFEEDPVAILAAFGSEMAVLRLEAAAALLETGVEASEVAETLEGLELEWMRFAAALREADPMLFEEAEEAFEAVEEAVEQAGPPAAAVEAALPLARQVRDTVSGPLVEEPEYAAAILSLLLVSETGIAEGWEEAVEGEVGPYAVGWAAVPRAYQLWEVVKPQADENQVFEIEDQLSELQLLFEDPTPPRLEGADPEAGESPAVRVAGFLEDVTGAWLFPDRDLAGLLRNTREVAAAGCEAYEAGDELSGDAHIAWVGYAYGAYLSGTLGLFAPEPTAELGELLSGVSGEEEDGEEGEAEEDESGEEGEFAEEDESADEDGSTGGEAEAERAFSPGSCPELLEALSAAGEPLGL